MALLAVDLDVPGGLLDEAVDHAQPEAGALAGPLGGEERVEHLVEDAGGNADAGIAPRDQGIVARFDVAVHAGVILVEIDRTGFEDKLAAVRHGVAGVERKIEKGGRELVWIDGRWASLVLEN